MTRLATSFEPLRALNGDGLSDPRVTVINRDAFVWISECQDVFDTVVIDFPDPGTYSIGKLYTTRFYRMLRDRLTENARVSIQCTSPLVAPKSYWCILKTMEASGLNVRPYRVSVPTFGVWGFALAGPDRVPSIPELVTLDGTLRFLNQPVMEDLFHLPADIEPVDADLNRLNDQVLVRYYEQEWNQGP